MTQDSLVSIIIPTYNSGKYLNRCLTSLTMQTYKKLEVIIVDAGSCDNTSDIVKQCKTKINIRYFEIGKSTQSEARNYGMVKALGKYITFCDSDDFYLPEKIKKQVGIMEESHIDVTYFDVLHFFSSQKRRLFLNLHPQNEDILAECIANQTINLNSVMVRKCFLDEKNILFPSGLMGKFGEDANFIFQLAVYGGKFKKLNEYLSIVEVRNDSHTQWEAQWQMKYYAICYRQEARPKVASFYQTLIDHSIRKLQYKLGVAYLIAGKYHDAKMTLKQVISAKLHRFFAISFAVLRLIPHPFLRWIIMILWRERRRKLSRVYPTLPPETYRQIMLILDIAK